MGAVKPCCRAFPYIKQKKEFAEETTSVERQEDTPAGVGRGQHGNTVDINNIYIYIYMGTIEHMVIMFKQAWKYYTQSIEYC